MTKGLLMGLQKLQMGLINGAMVLHNGEMIEHSFVISTVVHYLFLDLIGRPINTSELLYRQGN